MLRDIIFKADDTGLVKRDVKEWGVTLYLKKWSGSDRIKYTERATKIDTDNAISNVDALIKIQAYAIIISACEEDGSMVFKDEDEERLVGKNSKVLEELNSDILRLNGLSEKAFSEALKNLETDPEVGE